MTHEQHNRLTTGTEPRGGPERDDRLPDAASIPVYENPEDSFAEPLTEDIDDDPWDSRHPWWWR